MTAAAGTLPQSPIDVLLYVQHLLGIGHLRRAALLAKALNKNGISVVLVSGGAPVNGLDIGGAGVTAGILRDLASARMDA